MDDVPKLPGPDQPPETTPSGGGFATKIGWPLAAMVVALCGLTAFLVQQCNPVTQVTKLGAGVAKGMEQLVDAISEHRVTQSFVEHLDMLKPDLKNRMLVVERQTTEIFTSKDDSWLGTTTTELRVPVTYHYYIALSGDWNLSVQVTPSGVVGEVIAPPLQGLEPTINTSQMEWTPPDGLPEDTLKNLTGRLDKLAFTQLPQNFPPAREAVEKFVRDWMLREYHLAPGTPIYLHVKFRNEPGVELTPPPPKG